jgi:hypothetical protein
MARCGAGGCCARFRACEESVETMQTPQALMSVLRIAVDDHGNPSAWKEFDMKILMALPVAGALLMAVPVATMAEDMAQSSDASKASMQNSANASEQATTDMSYGGSMDTRTSSGKSMQMQHTRNCSTGPQCDIFFGN